MSCGDVRRRKRISRKKAQIAQKEKKKEREMRENRLFNNE
jgi:hypothetical protein